MEGVKRRSSGGYNEVTVVLVALRWFREGSMIMMVVQIYTFKIIEGKSGMTFVNTSS